jgi:ribose/xylose/arabinose/galactoside ABC-type transport system permease subunit
VTVAVPPAASAPPAPARPPRRPPRRAVRRVIARRESQLVVVTLVVGAISTLLHSNFAALGNISFMLSDAMAVAIVAVGQTIVVLGRGIDLSVAPILGVAAVSVGFLAQNHGLSPLLGVPLVLAFGAVLGVGNGLLVAGTGIPPIIATLGTLSVYGGLEAIICNGQEVTTLPPSYFTLGNSDVINGVPWLLLIGLAVTALFAVILRHSAFGRSVYAVGSNAEGARRAGLAVRRVLLQTYVLSGMLAGLGGLVYLAHTGSADSTTGADTNIELTSIAATLIGGSTLTGGRGGVVGSFLGAIFLSVALTALVFAGVSAIWEPAGVGVLILLAVVADRGPAQRSWGGALAALFQRPGARA